MTNATDVLAIRAARVKGWEPYKYEATDNGFLIVHGAVPERISKTGRPVWRTGKERKYRAAPNFYKVIVLSHARIKALEKQMGTSLQERAKSIPLVQGNLDPPTAAAPPAMNTPEAPKPPTFGSFRTRG